eukprot:505556-Pyramimonas_sp.AAC.1
MKNLAVFIDDMGREISCTLQSPAMFKVLLRQAVLRQLERAAYHELVEGGLFCGLAAPAADADLACPSEQLAPDRTPPELSGSN